MQGSPAHTGQIASSPGKPQQDPAQLVDQAQALALAVQFSKRAQDAQTLDDLYLLLTNDVRVLVEFDRAFLMVHLGRDSKCVAASGQATLETKSKFHHELANLARGVAGLDRLLLVARQDIKKIADIGLDEKLVSSLESYIEFSECELFLCVPLVHRQAPVGHLVFEFLGEGKPDSNHMLALRNVGSFLAATLVERWLLHRKPGLSGLTTPGSGRTIRKARLFGVYLPLSVLALAALWYLLFMIPFTYRVGGEATISPGKRHVAFCKMEGLIEKVLVAEGTVVSADQVLATLDRRDLLFRIHTAQRELEILRQEASILTDGAGADPSKLALVELTEIKVRNKLEEVRYLESRREFLDIRAPLAGVIVTKDVETLAGKKVAAGEAFCEIAVPEEFRVDTYVPEDRITYVKPGQEAEIFFNSDPARGYSLKVSAIAPKAEALPRHGNVFRVEAPFSEAPSGTMVGMKGIGKIQVQDLPLWEILSQRLLTRWNQLSLYF
ncbi:MAG: HlyD family efflux transporter periplasmic adaptor subunit [Thermodesulfobacteriota bacterium]